jgi:hypothetical protein
MYGQMSKCDAKRIHHCTQAGVGLCADLRNSQKGKNLFRVFCVLLIGSYSRTLLVSSQSRRSSYYGKLSHLNGYYNKAPGTASTRPDVKYAKKEMSQP